MNKHEELAIINKVKERMKISKQLENKEVLICPICNENPSREGLKTCSKECSEIYKKTYIQTYQKALSKLRDKHKKEFEKIRMEIKNEKR